jgi:hypothetical protein
MNNKKSLISANNFRPQYAYITNLCNIEELK